MGSIKRGLDNDNNSNDKNKKSKTNSNLCVCFDPLIGTSPHTLILGTMPSPQSLQWFAHSSNSFWNIAGDSLGFQRSDPYKKRVEIFTSSGYALWDSIQSCVRAGSKDSDITDETPADIKGLIGKHPTIRRLVFDSKASANLFLKHNKNWLLEKNQFFCGNKFASDVFGAIVSTKTNDGVTLMVMHSTSQRRQLDYSIKLNQWKSDCYNITNSTNSSNSSNSSHLPKLNATNSIISNTTKSTTTTTTSQIVFLDDDAEIDDFIRNYN